MSIISRLSINNNIVKILIIIAAIILIVGGVYSYSNKESSGNSENILANVEPEAINSDMSVKSAEDVEKVIAYWIDQNPEAIIRSVTKLQQKAAQEQINEARKNISSNLGKIFNKKSPNYSPRKYDVTIVEFYDYNCGYCKQASKSVDQLIKSDKKVRVIYRDFPILGKSSRELSRVSIAASIVDSKKFHKFHSKLMSSRVSSKEEAIKIAGNVGINISKLKKALDSKGEKIDSILQENLKLGSEIGINGTPAFIIGEELIPGAVDVAALKAKIAQQRAK